MSETAPLGEPEEGDLIALVREERTTWHETMVIPAFAREIALDDLEALLVRIRSRVKVPLHDIDQVFDLIKNDKVLTARLQEVTNRSERIEL